MPLQNRVSPFGELFATPARGLLMGNRGGRIHDDKRQLASRRWASRQWICCVLDFKNRQRKVFGAGYSELFFLDEVTALAAGHRPCFECRRRDAIAFAEYWSKPRPSAPQMDAVLQRVGVAAFSSAVVAYEPVWAIGTGRTATSAQAQEVHAAIRAQVAVQDAGIAEGLRILYGGSVKPQNAKELFGQSDIDGGLIGGAALVADDFLKICLAAN